MADQNIRRRYHEDGPARATPVKLRPVHTPPKLLPPWKVLLHNDDVNEIADVIGAVRLLTPLNKEEATARVKEAHTTGVALLLVTHRERAELYVEQFASCSLTVTAEPEAL